MKHRRFKIMMALLLICAFPKVQSQTTNDYVELRDYQKVNFKVQSEYNSLKRNVATKVRFTFENSNPKTINLSAPNMKILIAENTENSVMVEITAEEKFIDDNTFSVWVSGKYDGKAWIYNIKIPVK